MRNAARKRRTVAEYGPDPVDVHVGSRVRLRRTLLGMSQEALGNATGITFQQLQKRENGANRISASALYKTAEALKVPMSYFFDDMPPETAQGKAPTTPADNPIMKRETLELVRAYYLIRDPKVRKALHAMTEAMAKSADR